ncbi:MAG: hypothetical protein LBK07_07920 [Tannerella sp.]|jgi:hypothetical protein|nr:hypothetical protein [Tannerella sp.]
MKHLIAILGLALAAAPGQAGALKAQNVSVNIHVNLDRQPAWGPSGYRYAAFYYFPGINVYYDVDRELFCYRRRGRWVESFYLPSRYGRYDLYSLYKVVLNDMASPWTHNSLHRRTYARFKSVRTQAPIYRMSDARYHKAKSNTRAWVAPRKPAADARRADRNSNDRRPVVRDSGRETRRDAAGRDREQTGRKDAPAARSSRRTDSDGTATSRSNRSSREKTRAADDKRTERRDRSGHTEGQ